MIFYEGEKWNSVLLDGVWKLRVTRKIDKERWPFYLVTEDIKHMLLNCSHPNKWRGDF